MAKNIALDKNLAFNIQEYIRYCREAAATGKDTRCTIRLCSTQRLGKFVTLMPFEFAAGLQDCVSERIRGFFPQKGDAPRDDIGFNYFVSNVIFDNFDHYGAFFRRQAWQVEVVFQVELPENVAG